MDDYERTNAREWDTEPSDTDPAEEGWQTVQSGKKRDVKPLLHPAENASELVAKSQVPNSVQQQYEVQPARAAQSQRQTAMRERPTRLQSRGTPPPKGHISGTSRAPQAARAPPRILEDPDNEGVTAWRNHQPATDSVRISRDAALDKIRYYAHIATQYGVYIPPHTMRGGGHGDTSLDIYGEAKAVGLAKEAIINWNTEVTGGRHSAKFPRIQSLTPALREKAERSWARDVIRQMYRQHPPFDMAFQAIGNFHWPIQDCRPEEILGSCYEALDPVRMSNRCYIIYQKERNLFRIMGKSADVQRGLLRLRKICFQVAARHVEAARKYMLRWAKDADIPTTVYFEEYQRPTGISAGEVVTEKPCKLPTGYGNYQSTKRSQIAEKQTACNQARLRDMLLKSISKLHYRRGCLEMRVRLGTFLAFQYRQPRDDGLYDLKEFEAMMAQSEFIGVVTQEYYFTALLCSDYLADTVQDRAQAGRESISP